MFETSHSTVSLEDAIALESRKKAAIAKKVQKMPDLSALLICVAWLAKRESKHFAGDIIWIEPYLAGGI